MRVIVPLCFAFLASTAFGQTVLHQFKGTKNSGYGTSADGAGDVDADGVPDLVIGAPYGGPAGQGMVEIRSGKDYSALHTFFFGGSSAVGARYGQAVAGVGDVDNDGHADVIVGAPLDATAPPSQGTARVYSGQTGGVLWTLTGAGAEQFGQSVGGAGDVDNDGVPDFIVGSFGHSRVFSGQSAALLFDVPWWGFAVAGAGDVNGDGFADVIAGNEAIGNGTVEVHGGPTGALLHSFQGATFGDAFGRSVDGAGDVDGDGRDDVIIGAEQYLWILATVYGPGYADVRSGASGALLHHFTGATSADLFGYAVGGGGDVDGDGRPDVVIGAIQTSLNGPVNDGYARAFSGATGALLFDMPGPAVDGTFGSSVAIPGDTDQNGYADVLVGSQVKGTVHLVSNCDGAAIPYGSGCPGGGGAPLLFVAGCPLSGGAITIGVANGLPGASAFFFVGTTPAALSMGMGCTLNVTPAFGPFGPFALGATGATQIPAVIPPAVAATTIVLQAFVAPATSPSGFGNSAGMKLIVP